jgi:hypothetical protein
MYLFYSLVSLLLERYCQIFLDQSYQHTNTSCRSAHVQNIAQDYNSHRVDMPAKTYLSDSWKSSFPLRIEIAWLKEKQSLESHSNS